MRRGLKVAAIVAAMAATIAAGAYIALMVAVRGKEVSVPDLREMTEAEAQAEASRRELVAEVADTREDPIVPPGRVVSQDPLPGARTRPGRSIKLVMSAPDEGPLVPVCIGSPVQRVRLELAGLGFRAGVLAHVPSDSGPAGIVLAQRPAAGVHRGKGEAIDLLVSTGPRDRVYVMPDVVGVALDRATSLLSSGGMRTGVVRKPAPEGAPSGVVIGQQPRSGGPVSERQTVRLVVSP